MLIFQLIIIMKINNNKVKKIKIIMNKYKMKQYK